MVLYALVIIALGVGLSLLADCACRVGCSARRVRHGAPRRRCARAHLAAAAPHRARHRADYANKWVYSTEAYADLTLKIERQAAVCECGWRGCVSPPPPPPPADGDRARPHDDPLPPLPRRAAVDEIRSRPGSREVLRRREREVAHMDTQLKTDRQLLGGLSLRAMALSAGAQFGTFWLLRSLFSSVVIATLPFEPPGLFRGMTHMGLPGANGREASFLLFYMLGNMGIKPLLAKALRIEPPKGAGAAMDLSKMMSGGAGGR